ncbi:MAG: rhodanese-like domain-containing protein [Bacillota bacterium]
MKRFAALFGLILLGTLVNGCAGVEVAGYSNIGVEEARELIQENPGLQIVDVREPYEFEQGHLPGSLLIPLGQLSGRMGELNQEQPVLVVCASGSRSGVAAGMLTKADFKEVYNLAPGLARW